MSSVHKRLVNFNVRGVYLILSHPNSIAVIMGQHPCVVFVHFGAGYHSKTNENLYKNLMELCCAKTLSQLAESDDLVSSLVQGIKILEDSGLLNAGKGSNKNLEGIVEADAALMTLDPPCLGSIGGATEFPNPIDGAKDAYFYALEKKKMSSVIFGSKLKRMDEAFNGSKWSSMETCTSLNSDTVGIICINSMGQLGMACSSGGPEGKIPGRIGPCAIPGSGFWGIKTVDNYYAALFTGIGEQIIIKGGARSIIEYMSSSSIDIEVSEFLENLYSSFDAECAIEFGFLSVIVSRGLIEIFSSHSTPSFIFGWKSSKDLVSTIHISRLENEKFKSFATCLQIK